MSVCTNFRAFLGGMFLMGGEQISRAHAPVRLIFDGMQYYVALTGESTSVPEVACRGSHAAERSCQHSQSHRLSEQGPMGSVVSVSNPSSPPQKCQVASYQLYATPCGDSAPFGYLITWIMSQRILIYMRGGKFPRIPNI